MDDRPPETVRRDWTPERDLLVLFTDGVSDALRGKLATLPGLEVTARSSAVQYKKTAKPIQLIGRELGVDYVLTGTVRWAKGKDGTEPATTASVPRP